MTNVKKRFWRTKALRGARTEQPELHIRWFRRNIQTKLLLSPSGDALAEGPFDEAPRALVFRAVKDVSCCSVLN